ncbi:MAG: hypothetical protein EDX89_18960 [Acidobacteria bacterium]|nr:MAG: hypothetical protein EDX89_18960 [Acidobacteriota bacterium]MCE7957954.1 hypothetical protein [Acidobacteria bacterium ACB2]
MPRARLLVPIVLPLLLARPAAAAPPPKAPAAKPRVAVLQFEDKTSRYSWYQAGRSAQEMLITELVKAGKFRVVERDRLQTLMAEKDLSLSGDVDPKTAVKAGQLLGVEFLVVGAVTELGVSDSRASAPGYRGFPGFSVKTQKMEAALDARAISTATGEIVWSDSERDSTSDSSVYVAGAGGGTEDRQKLDRVLRPIVGGLARSLARAELPTTGLGGAADASGVAGKIAKADGSTVFLNVGSEAGVSPGDEFDVYRVGDPIKDPDTGEVLGADEKKVGRVRVTAVKGARLSTAAVVTGSGLQAGDVLKVPDR